MKKYLLFVSACFTSTMINAQIAGPNSASTFANVAIAGSNKSWTNTGNAAASDNTYATYGSLAGSSPSYTDYLQATNFNFSIPGGVSITGIVVEVERADPNQRTSDYRIRIVKGGVIGTAERSSGAAYGSADGYQTFGNSGDLWGDTWTEADINASNFGVAIAAIRTVNGANAGRIDHIRIIVYYDFVVLPLKLNSFSAKKNKNNVDINWITSDESNMNHYEVERSVNGGSFSLLTNVNSLNQAASATYTSSDINPNKGINYYRLKMVENSGRVVYSKIISVHFSSGNTMTLFPNPWVRGSELNITNLNGDQIGIEFYSVDGQMLGTSISSGRSVSTGSLKLIKGIVLYRMKNSDGFIIGSGSLQVY